MAEAENDQEPLNERRLRAIAKQLIREGYREVYEADERAFFFGAADTLVELADRFGHRMAAESRNHPEDPA